MPSHPTHRVLSLSRLLILAAVLPTTALAQQRASSPSARAGAAASGLPLKHDPRPTTAAITAADLMTRLYVYADDSMLGRQAGTENNTRATAYIAAELRRLGLEPAGEGGTFFQDVPIVRRGYADSSVLVAGSERLTIWKDFAPANRRGVPRPLDEARVVFGGTYGDTAGALSREQMKGKLVVFLPPGAAIAQAAMTRLRAESPFAEAAGMAIVGLEQLPAASLAVFRQPTLGLRAAASSAPPVPVSLIVTRRAAERLLGVPLEGARVGTTGRAVTGTLALVETPAPARNVVALLRGRDPALRGQYVAIGAHNDHVGFNRTPVDHDSLKAFNAAAWAMAGKYAGLPPLSRERRASIVVNVDSLRRVAPPRPDSIANGADDDGSGSVAVLEIAEAMARAPQRPRRSVLFVWHTAEELGLLGSRWFTDHPTVPRDSIVAQINIDMIGRGGAADTRGGGPDYLGLVGSRRLSSELGDLVEAVNRAQRRPLAFDYGLDAKGHPENIYCRSDHYNYARYGIPIVFFFTGLHGDYHQVTDEPQYIDYPHLERITRFIGDLTTRVANLPRRPVVDGEKPDPAGVCRQ